MSSAGRQKRNPSGHWLHIACFGAMGAVVGLGVAVAHISRASSYLSDSPETCINCHVMYPQYTTWAHSAHANVAHCNDCHVPHDNLVSHYAFKAKDGLKHAAVFTARAEPQVIRLSKAAVPVVQDNCMRCHTEVVHSVQILSDPDEQRLCWDCHRHTPHGRVRSLSATPQVLRPQLAPIGLKDPGHRVGARPPRDSSTETGHDAQ